MHAIALGLLWMIQALQTAAGIPASPGVYCLQDGRNWISLEKASITKTRADGLDLFVETGGYTNVGVESVLPGAKALTRIPEPRPVFGVREAGSSSDVTLIRLDKKKNSRAFRTSYANSTLGNKGGYNKSDIIRTAVTSNPDGAFQVKPEVDLKPGEYLLILGEPGNSFDFGIDRGK